MQNLQEVQPAFAVGALEVGEQVVADRGAIAVLAVMTGPGVVGADVRRRGQPRRQHLVLLLVKGSLVFGQDAVELARRDVDAVLPQLLQQQRLGDLGLMILVQDVGDQVRPEVPALDRQHALRKRRQHRAAVRQVIACPQVAGVFALDDEFLDDVRLRSP